MLVELKNIIPRFFALFSTGTHRTLKYDGSLKSNDGERDENWKLSNFNGTVVTGSGTPPKLWIKVPPQVMEEDEGNTE